jgi:hypothetical protein
LATLNFFRRYLLYSWFLILLLDSFLRFYSKLHDIFVAVVVCKVVRIYLAEKITLGIFSVLFDKFSDLI